MHFSSAVAREEVVGDGKVFVNKDQFESIERPIVLTPGEKYRVGIDGCPYTKSLFSITRVCTWEKTVVGTMTGAPQVIVCGTETTEGYRVETICILVAVVLMLIAVVSHKVSGGYSRIIFCGLILSSTLSVYVCFWVVDISLYHCLLWVVTVFVSFWALLTYLEKNMNFFRSAGASIVLSITLFFMVV